MVGEAASARSSPLPQGAGAIRADVALDEVMALLISTTQGAVRAGWDRQLQDRVPRIVFAGLA